jgi:hypothetical protein
MGDAAYPDKWDGWAEQRGRNPNSRVQPQGEAAVAGREAGIHAEDFAASYGDQGDSLPSPWTPC